MPFAQASPLEGTLEVAVGEARKQILIFHDSRATGGLESHMAPELYSEGTWGSGVSTNMSQRTRASSGVDRG